MGRAIKRLRKGRHRRGKGGGLRGGFTLLELLISMTLLAVIMVIVLGAFRLGISAWEKGERAVEARQRHRIILDYLKQQLSSMHGQKRQTGEETFLSLRGDHKSMAFFSHLSILQREPTGVIFVNYEVSPSREGERLLLRELNTLSLHGTVSGRREPDGSSEVLLQGVRSVEFEYFRADRENGQPGWQETWDEKRDGVFPLAVKVILRDEGDEHPLTLVARIEADRENTSDHEASEKR